MPRYEAGGAIPEMDANAHTATMGHDVMHLCAFCVEVLQSEP